MPNPVDPIFSNCRRAPATCFHAAKAEPACNFASSSVTSAEAQERASDDPDLRELQEKVVALLAKIFPLKEAALEACEPTSRLQKPEFSVDEIRDKLQQMKNCLEMLNQVGLKQIRSALEEIEAHTSAKKAAQGGRLASFMHWFQEIRKL